MSKYFLLAIFLLVFALLTSCKDKVICPAFQSTYILEEEASNKLFSLFGEDSLPKGKLYPKKDKYGMLVKVRYRKRANELRIIAMKDVHPQEQIDTLDVIEDAFVINDNDTLQLETAARTNVRFNNDQKSYMKYIGDDIAKAYERKQEEYRKIQREREEQEAKNPPKLSRKERKEERKKKKEAKEVIVEPEEEEDEWEKF